jgi:predicted RNase H-like HicB family nuclease
MVGLFANFLTEGLKMWVLYLVDLGVTDNLNMEQPIQTEQEVDGRWIADMPGKPGVMAYGSTRREAIDNVRALALRVLADQIENATNDNAHLDL